MSNANAQQDAARAVETDHVMGHIDDARLEVAVAGSAPWPITAPSAPMRTSGPTKRPRARGTAGPAFGPSP